MAHIGFCHDIFILSWALRKHPGEAQGRHCFAERHYASRWVQYVFFQRPVLVVSWSNVGGVIAAGRRRRVCRVRRCHGRSIAVRLLLLLLLM